MKLLCGFCSDTAYSHPYYSVSSNKSLTEQAHQAVALRLGVDMGLFDVVVAAKGKPIGVKKLASPIGADTQLVGESNCRGYVNPMLIVAGRVIRMLAAMGFFEEINHDMFTSTRLTG